MQSEVAVWKMGQSYKVYSDDTGMIRQLGAADDCKVSAEYHDGGRFCGLDAILPFKAKFGRRIMRVLAKKGFKTPSKWPNLAQGEVLTLKREIPCLDKEVPLKTDI